MSEPALAHADFPAFFRAVWGFELEPFPWQQALVRRLADGEGWPDVLDLPTGAGKTAALDIALFHLALEADRKGERRAPVRIAFVVDRRLIVDDAYTRADRLSQALAWSLATEEDAAALAARQPDLAGDIRRVRAEPVVKGVAVSLRGLAGPGQPPLVARRLRGGAPREDDWARTPVQPTILCSTVDQVGSRLLFRGYGVSDSMKPVHAGLLGSDCLILLDEAHLSEPFRQTLRWIGRLRAPDPAPFAVAVLTATPQDKDEGESKEAPFGLSIADESHPILSRRLAAPKPARLVDVAGKQGIDAETRRAEETAHQAAAVLSKLQAAGVEKPAVGVVVNRVARARAVFERLEAQLKDAADTMLLIGPARSVDRDDLARRLEPIRTRHPDAPRRLPKPLIVVATQTIEAGVDIDFDGLVTEAASLDALKQRFGRLNRAGRKITPEAAILAHKEDIGTKADDPVYGDRIRLTWQKLQQIAAGADGIVDFGIEALKKQIARDEAGTLAAPTSDAPILMPAYADLWSHTSPIPNADPEVALFLHGPDRSPASVQIVWRADLDEARDLSPAIGNNETAKDVRERLIELLELVPPRATEAIEVPLWAARAWLDQPRSVHADFSDSVERGEDPGEQQGPHRRAAFRWAGRDSDRTSVIFGRGLRNGDLIVVPADYGGCDRWGWNPKPADDMVMDVADAALWPYRGRRFAVRVTPDLVVQSIAQARKRGGVDADAPLDREAIAAKLSELLAQHEDDGARDLLDRVLEWCISKHEASGLPECLDGVADVCLPLRLKHLVDRCKKGTAPRVVFCRTSEEQPPHSVIFLAPRGLEAEADDVELAALPSTESDELSVSSDKAVSIQVHCDDVRAWAESFAVRAGLRSNEGAAVALAALLHDHGKADRRFQAFLAGGDPYGSDVSEPLAKSGEKRLPPGAGKRAQLPPRWRHEALSVRLATLHADFKRAHDPELVLWLIGTHHGHGRPLFPHADELDAQAQVVELPPALGGKVTLAGGHGPQSLAFDFEGRDWAQMFETLKERYGIWGLARLEAFVRLADHRASETGAPPAMVAEHKEAAE